MVITCFVTLISKREMAIALLFVAITKRVMVIAGLIQGKTTQVGSITNLVAVPAVKGVFVAIVKACITC